MSRTFPILTPIDWGLLKQPDKQELASQSSSRERRAEAFVVHFVGPLCRKWPETAWFDKVFDKGSRHSGLNGWFWDRL
jgi:hypothetical protein